MAAWMTGIGPQVILMNSTTGQIRHTKCNSWSDLYYSPTDSSVLSLEHRPKNNTPIAGEGWFNEQITIASIFYFDEDNRIVNALYDCDMDTGLFTRTGSYIISEPELSIHPESGLTAINLGGQYDWQGYRLYFHDANMTVNEYAYNPVEVYWTTNGPVSKDVQTSPAIDAAWSGTNNISVVTPRDDENAEISRFHNDGKWHISTLPRPLEKLTTTDTKKSDIKLDQDVQTNFTMPEWSGKPKGIGISIDESHTRFVWYIGNDSKLHQLSSKGFVWKPMESKTDVFWPVADEPNAEIAVASKMDSGKKKSEVHVFYMVDNKLAQVSSEDGSWKAWSHIPERDESSDEEDADSTQTTGTGTSSSPTSPASSSTGSAPPAAGAAVSSGLSTGAKIGIAVGAALGAVALIAIVVALYLLRRKKAPASSAASLKENAPKPSTSYGTDSGAPSPGYEYYGGGWGKNETEAPPYPAQLDMANNPTELSAVPRPVYELAEQSYTHELVGADAQGHGQQQQQQQQQQFRRQ